MYTVRVGIGVSPNINDFAFVAPHFKLTSTIVASRGLEPTLVFIPYSRVVNVLPRVSTHSADIGINSGKSRAISSLTSTSRITWLRIFRFADIVRLGSYNI